MKFLKMNGDKIGLEKDLGEIGKKFQIFKKFREVNLCYNTRFLQEF
jgi:hypothetical protein